MINVKENKYSLELAHHFKPIAPNEFSYEFSPVIGQITSISKDAPVYLIKPTKEIQHLAISIKESASMLHEEIASLLSLTKSTKKTGRLRYVSDHPDCLSIRMLSEATENRAYSVHIEQAALGQINQSSYVSKNASPFTAGTYAFSITKDDVTKRFEILLESAATNLEIFHKIKHAIEHSEFNLSCSIDERPNDASLIITAAANRQDKPAQFSIQDHGSRFIHFYKLHTPSKEPQPSRFQVNGDSIVSFGTTFVIDEHFEITLLSTCEKDIHVYTVEDQDFAFTSFHKILDCFNYLLELSRTTAVHKLEQELMHIINENLAELSNAGIVLDDNSYMLSFRNNNTDASDSIGNLEMLYSSADSFAPALLTNADKISINPMEYVPKKVVSYPDLSRPHFPNPYMTSMYSGFLFCGCC